MKVVPGMPLATLTWIIYEGCTWQGSDYTDLDYNYVKVVPGKPMGILTWIIIM